MALIEDGKDDNNSKVTIWLIPSILKKQMQDRRESH